MGGLSSSALYMQTTRQTPVDRAVGALAARQHGVVTRAHLTAIGLGRAQIDSRVRAGHLYRVHRGVYAVGQPALTTKGRFMAAVVAYGDRAVLSHRSAAVLWGLQRERGPRIDVTVPEGGGLSRRRCVIVHRSRLAAHETTRTHDIPVTTPARTVVDLADISTRRELERTLDEADYLRLDLDRLRPIPGRRGAGRLGAGPRRPRARRHPDALGVRGASVRRLQELRPAAAAREPARRGLHLRLRLAGRSPGRRDRRLARAWHPRGLRARPVIGTRR